MDEAGLLEMMEKESCQIWEDTSDRKQKYTIFFMVGDCAKVGKYAEKNGVGMAQKHFKQLFIASEWSIWTKCQSVLKLEF